MIIGSYINGEYEREWYGQGFIYKDYNAFKNKNGVCYIPELSDTKYSYNDFLKIAGGDENYAELLFERVDCQSPETLVVEDENESRD